MGLLVGLRACFQIHSTINYYRSKTKTAITHAFLTAANIAAWTWALVAFLDRHGLADP